MKGMSVVIWSFSVLVHSFKNDRSFGFDSSRFLFIHWVIWCFWPKWNIFQSNYFLGSLVFLEMLEYSCQFVTFKLIGHWVIWCFRQSFEQKLQPQILQPPSLSTRPNILWMLDPACWPNLPQHKDSQHLLTLPTWL